MTRLDTFLDGPHAAASRVAPHAQPGGEARSITAERKRDFLNKKIVASYKITRN